MYQDSINIDLFLNLVYGHLDISALFLNLPMQLFTHGQWWSILRTHLWQILKKNNREFYMKFFTFLFINITYSDEL